MQNSVHRSDSDGEQFSNAPIVGNPAWSSVLIVEGTSGVGKSTLIDQLVRRYVADIPTAEDLKPKAKAEEVGD